jgi:predicted PurR-regulated permease PerM
MKVAAFLIIQLMDNVLIQPLIVSKSVNLHPLVIIFAVIIGGQFFGILGMLLAVPATGILKVFAIELYNSFQKYGMV